ncbi:Phytosulfokine-beta like [Actinidia chinensis var. chinensis]|uniref:Phytosulfokine n=1 Tax=Actinidia chinensis var. chinensis TaxID=1590841 RepID=A0A2R6R1Z0_ACTCC|nr:Phytosulfokine-beta like [Actinidia chinensis var. chinensis]
MAIIRTLCTIALLLFLALTCTARPEPAFHNSKTQHQDVEVGMENCEGVGEDECLMRRTLAAHVDYIYTQKHQP